MRIPVVAGVGRGRTLLSAFDAALNECGMPNCNVIRLGTAIPSGASVFEADRTCSSPHEDGDRLYAVMAEYRSERAGRAIAAGIGWYQWLGGRGVIAEHGAEGDSTIEVEAEVLELIYASLRDLCETRGVPFDGMRVAWRLASAEVGVEPAAVVVLAVYGAEPWERSVVAWPERRAG